jgi:hypothetical protein
VLCARRAERVFSEKQLGAKTDRAALAKANGSSVTLFGGKVPPNGFMLRVFPNGQYQYDVGAIWFVNDNGAARLGVSFYFLGGAGSSSASAAFENGYKLIGPVRIWCQTGGVTVYLTARSGVSWGTARGIVARRSGHAGLKATSPLWDC